MRLIEGRGVSLIAPESIGGSINLITREAIRSGLLVSSEWGSQGTQQTSVLASAVDRDSGFIVMAHEGSNKVWDVDANGIAESPARANQAITFKLTERFADNLELKLRYSEAELSILGGNTVGFKPTTYSSSQAEPEDFQNYDVRQAYIGDIARISESIELRRKELAASLEWYVNESAVVDVKLSETKQFQNAIYSHAFDYNNEDTIRYAGINLRLLTDSNHLLSFGLETKHHTMEFSSEALFQDRTPPLPQDNFGMRSIAGYAFR